MPTISSLLDSDMEDNMGHIDENSLLSSDDDSNPAMAKKDATKKPKKRKCVTMPKKQKTVKPTPSDQPKPATKKVAPASVAGAKRKAATEPVEADHHPSDREETQPKQRGRPRAPTKPKPSSQSTDSEFQEGDVDLVTTSNFAATKSSRTAPRPTAKPKATAPKTVQHHDQTAASLEDAEPEPSSQPARKKPRTQSLVRQELSYRRRAGSASDTERGDPMLRRKLGDITRKFENIDTKYRTLKETGIVEASANVEKLRQQCEATTEASNKLIASLRKELALHSTASQKTKKLEKELQTRDADKDKLAKTNHELSASLAAANNEIKALQAKLAAARSSSVVPEAKAAPSSTVNPRIAQRQHSASEAEAQLKLDLYSDLTGLIIRTAKQAPDGDTYDCIQTGRNGTLHFKLFVDLEEAKAVSFEETEFLYTPLLDTNRDRDMIEIMPPYLVEDITFARGNAAKFYARVVDTLTKKLVVVDDGTNESGEDVS